MSEKKLVYFVDIHGNLSEYEIVNPIEENLMIQPANGCDMLVRRTATGHISSAKRVHYYDSPQEALRAFIDKQDLYVDQWMDRLKLEMDARLNAWKKLISL